MYHSTICKLKYPFNSKPEMCSYMSYMNKASAIKKQIMMFIQFVTLLIIQIEHLTAFHLALLKLTK